MVQIVNEIILDFIKKFFAYLPNFLGGLLIFIIGVLIGSILKQLIISLLIFIRVDALLQKTRLMDKKAVVLWEEIISEVIKWTVIVLFLIPTLEVWGLSRATIVLNQFLLYLPNVLVALIISFVGIVSSNLISDVVSHSVGSLGATSAKTLSAFAKWIVLFFTTLIVLNQLGVAQDLIRILFTGIVAMVALAGGLAFGIGGKEIAKELLEEMRKKAK